MANQTSFSSVTEYVNAASGKKSVAAVPEGVAAEYLGISLSGVSDLLKKGVLQAMVVEGERSKWRGVMANSLVKNREKREKERAEWTGKIRKILEDAAKKGKIIEYGTITEVLGVSSSPQNRAKVSDILDEVAAASHKRDEVLLSALVILKARGLPNDKFFANAATLGAMTDEDEPKSFWEAQTAAVFRKYGKGKKKK